MTLRFHPCVKSVLVHVLHYSTIGHSIALLVSVVRYWCIFFIYTRGNISYKDMYRSAQDILHDCWNSVFLRVGMSGN